MSEHYPDFGRYESELRTDYPDNHNSNAPSSENDVDWTSYERSFSIKEQSWSELLGVIECMQRAVDNGEDINSQAYEQVKNEAKEEELFGVPILMTHGIIRPISVNKFEKIQ